MYYKRTLEADLLRNIKNDLILLVLGARQTGKTTLLKRILSDIEKEEICFFVNLENPEYKKLLNDHPQNLEKIIAESFTEKKRMVIFIDEIQYLNDPSGFLKFIYDEHKENVKLIVSGSSSFYIDRRFRDSLAGRKKVFNLYTLNFVEFLRFKKEEEILKIFESAKEMPLMHKDRYEWLFSEYITYGGYPGIVLTEDNNEKEEILENMTFDYIKKDIFEARIQDEEKYFHLFKMLAQQCGQLVNVNELANALNLSQPTVENYLYVMQKSFHIALIRPYYTNIRKELSKMKKVFFYDLGIRNKLVSNFNPIEQREDRGVVLENLFFREMIFRERLQNIKYWRTLNKNEVDFVIGEKNAFEIKFSKSGIKETKYKIFRNKFPKIDMKFVTFDDIYRFIYNPQKENK